MKHNLTKIVCALALLGAAVTANAQLSWNWVYGGDMSGSGTLTTTANLGGYYQITGITGTFGGIGEIITRYSNMRRIRFRHVLKQIDILGSSKRKTQTL